MKGAVQEAVLVARDKGITVANDPYSATLEICRATAANISSMRQDVLKGKKTEIDTINGAVVREAAGLGIPVPVNDSLVRRVKEIEDGYKGTVED
jgi:2-dehydropantoate 2-reductase